MGKQFTAGDRVAWSHVVAPEHGSASVVRAAAVFARDAAASLGTVVGQGDLQNWWEVQLDDAEKRVLTGDELVRVEEA